MLSTMFIYLLNDPLLNITAVEPVTDLTETQVFGTVVVFCI